jgi:putative intracellular protease/amidase
MVNVSGALPPGKKGGTMHTDESAGVLLLIADGFEEQPVAACLSQLRAAGVGVDLLAPAAGLVTGAHGMVVRPDRSIESLPSGAAPDLLVVPGGAQCTARLLADPRVHRLLGEGAAQPPYVAAFRDAEPAMTQAGLPAAIGPERYRAQGRQPLPEYLRQLELLAVGTAI